MTLGLATAGGVVAGVVLWWLLRPVLTQPLFLRENWRGHTLPTAAGLVVALAVLLVTAVVALVHEDDYGALAGGIVGFAFLGLVDDLAAGGTDGRGFAGHVRALGRGRLTTGGLKLVGGGAVAVVACAGLEPHRPARILLDAVLVALAANGGNLFDRAPGRTTKVAAVAFVALVAAAGADDVLVPVGAAVGAAVGLLGLDLREHLMLGDTGANAVGAALGLGVVVSFGTTTRLVVAAVLVVVNLASEAVSFSRVIDAVAPLRWLDRLGRGSPGSAEPGGTM